MNEHEIRKKADEIAAKIFPNNGFIKCDLCGHDTCMYSNECSNCGNEIKNYEQEKI